MDITFTIPANKLDEFRTGFLKRNPVPLDDDDNPEMSDLAWLRFWVIRTVLREYKKGKMQLAKDLAFIDENVIS